MVDADVSEDCVGKEMLMRRIAMGTQCEDEHSENFVLLIVAVVALGEEGRRTSRTSRTASSFQTRSDLSTPTHGACVDSRTKESHKHRPIYLYQGTSSRAYKNISGHYDVLWPENELTMCHDDDHRDDDDPMERMLVVVVGRDADGDGGVE